MTLSDLHALFTNEFDLVPEQIERADSRTYFFRHVEWHPSKSTRTVRVFLDAQQQPTRLQLCASSDNNNTVLLHPPFYLEEIRKTMRHEVGLIESRTAEPRAAQGRCIPPDA